MSEENTLAALASEVEHARDALLEAAKKEPDRWWTASELATKARDWSGSVVMIALDDLLETHALEADPRWRVRLVH